MTLIDKQKSNPGKHRFFRFKHLPMDIARLLCSVLLPILRIKRRTPEGTKYKKKVRSGAIIAANHTAFIDPFVAAVTFWYRRVYFLVAEIVMQGRIRSFFLKGVGAIKIDRNAADIEAINKAIKTLKEGYLLSVFPQGGINKDGNVDTVKSGAILMAIRAGVPIIPMYAFPRKHWYNRRTVVIGNPIDPKDFLKTKFPSTSDINNMTTALAEELNRCKNTDII